jgi:hypothetical protein
MGSDTSGWTVIGRAKKNCLIRVNCGQIQDRRSARHQLGTRTAGRLRSTDASHAPRSGNPF